MDGRNPGAACWHEGRYLYVCVCVCVCVCIHREWKRDRDRDRDRDRKYEERDSARSYFDAHVLYELGVLGHTFMKSF